MIKSLFKDYIYPIAVFAGGMVGVGFLSLPYITSKIGLWPMIFYFVILTALVVSLNLIFCQISLKTPDYKRFPGFVGHYLGKWPKLLAFVAVILGTFGVLLAYLIVASQFLSAALGPLLGWNSLIYIFIYFVIASAIIYFDIKIVARVEFWILSLLFLSIILIFVEGLSQIKISNLFTVDSSVGLTGLFLPYGPLLFALWGIGLIPETEEMLLGRKKNLKKVITIATIIISGFYLFFTIVVLSITGGQTETTALTGLRNFLGDGVLFVALLFGVLATFTAFITQGMIFKKTLMFDLKIKHWQAFVITCFTPTILFLLGLKSFIPVLSFVGGVLLGVDGILILLMYKKVGGKNIIIYPLSLVFLLGLIYEIIYFIK